VRTTATVIAAAGLLAAAPLAAQNDAQNPRVHVVRRGETLWDIARNYLNDPFLWPEIFRLNTNVVEDPARIYPSERLVLPDGIPAAEPVFGSNTPRDTGPRVQFGDRADRPEVLAGDFYRVGFIARRGEVVPVGRFTEPEYRSVIDVRMTPQINLYDRVFVQVNESVREGDRLRFLRPGREMRNVGRVYRPTGVGTVAAVDGGVATVVIVGLYGQLEPNDIAVPWERFPLEPTARSQRGEPDLQGRVIAFEDEGRVLQRTESILFLDVGREAGVSVGDVFEAYEPRHQSRLGTRPEVYVARMQVVRVTGNSASVRVTELDQPSIAPGLAVRRVARMR
jgi:hypothetical protein